MQTIENKYGNVDIRDGIPDGYVHLDIPRVGAIAKRLGIPHAKAMTGFDLWGKYPEFSGIVIAAHDEPAIFAVLSQRENKRKKSLEKTSVYDALFSLNRRAKRCRDMAQTYYRRGMHGLAGTMKQEKENIYSIKGQALHYMLEEGLLSGGKYHKFSGGNFAEILSGNGYTFHRPADEPDDMPVDALMIDSIEAKPKKAKEPSLDVAREVIDKYLDGKPKVAVYEWRAKIIHHNRHWYDEEEEEEDDYDWDF